jgi:hypothetical protein
MLKPAWALTWELWGRQRLLMRCTLGYLVGAVILAQLVAGADWAPLVAVGLVVPLAGMLLFVLATCTYGYDVPFERTASGFPQRLLTLPVPTAALVGWPMLNALLALGLGWLVCVAGILRPCGMEVTLAWPALLLAAIGVAWSQVIAWAPFPWPWTRVVVVGALVPALPGGVWLWSISGAVEGVLLGGLIGLLLLAYPVAVRQVGQARRGEGTGWSWPERLSRLWLRAGKNATRSFSSPEKAQLWLEWRMRGRMMGLLSLVCLGLLLLGLFRLERALGTVAHSGAYADLTALVEATGTGWVMVGLVLVFSFLLATISGAELGKMTLTKAGYGLAPYLATRPLTTAGLVWLKFRLAVRTVLVFWALTLSVAGLWVVLAGKYAEMADRLLGWYGSGAHALLALVLGLAVLMLLSLAHLIRGLWIGLCGRTWVVWVAIVGGIALWSVVPVLAQHWLSDTRARATLVALLPWVLGGALVLKALAAGWVVWLLHQRALVGRMVLARLLGAWGVAALAVIGVISYLTPLRWDLVACGVVLWLPVARCGLAVLVLERDRHR